MNALNEAIVIDSEEHLPAVRIEIGANIASHCSNIQCGEMFEFSMNVFEIDDFLVVGVAKLFGIIGFADLAIDFD